MPRSRVRVLRKSQRRADCFEHVRWLWAIARSPFGGVADELGLPTPTGSIVLAGVPRGTVATGAVVVHLGTSYMVTAVTAQGAFGQLVELECEQVADNYLLAEAVTVGGRAVTVGGRPLTTCGASAAAD